MSESSRRDYLQDLHNRGQEDAAAGLSSDKNRHVDTGDLLFSTPKEQAENTEAYSKGYKHTEKQK